MVTVQEPPKRPAVYSGPMFGAYPQLRILSRLIANAFRALSERFRSRKSRAL